MYSKNSYDTLRDIEKYPYIVDVSGILSHENQCDLWLNEHYGESGKGRWRFFFNYYREPIFEQYSETGYDFAMFTNKEDMFEFMLYWK